MNIKDFIREKLPFIFYQTILFATCIIILYITGTNHNILFLLTLFLITIALLKNSLEYLKLKKEKNKIASDLNQLKKKYLIAEIIEKPTKLENQIYYDTLKIASKSMIEEITNIKNSRREYKEYIEEWIHEIKTPISAISLICDNQKNKRLKKEIDKINYFVEQCLYYARSNTVEKDYFIQKIEISEVIHECLIEYQEQLLENRVKIETENIDKTVFSDKKWLAFILNQILNNAIKYKSQNPKIKIATQNIKNATILTIEDNGIGIPKQDLCRVFQKGFTGSNREKKQSTGIGLYLCKKLCDRLNITIKIESEQNRYTKLILIFPEGNLWIKENEQ